MGGVYGVNNDSADAGSGDCSAIRGIVYCSHKGFGVVGEQDGHDQLMINQGDWMECGITKNMIPTKDTTVQQYANRSIKRHHRSGHLEMGTRKVACSVTMGDRGRRSFLLQAV